MRVSTVLKISDWEEARKDYDAGLITFAEFVKKEKELKKHIQPEEMFEYHQQLLNELTRRLKGLDEAFKKIQRYLKPRICGECGEIREDDERVKAGLKCGRCAYGY